MDVYEKALLLHEQWQGKLSTELKAKLEVEAHAFSKTAEEAIKAVGGNTTII